MYPRVTIDASPGRLGRYAQRCYGARASTRCVARTMDTIGKRIKFARERAKMSQSGLSRLVGVSSQIVSLWESDRKQPKRNNILRLAGFLLVTSDWLLKGGQLPEYALTSSIVPAAEQRVFPMVSMADAVSGRPTSQSAERYVAQAHASDTAYWIELPDDSNAPDFPRKSRGLFDPTAIASPGDVVLAAVGSDSRPVVGQLSAQTTPSGVVLVVTPRNPLWPAARSDHESLIVVAPMVEHTRIFR